MSWIFASLITKIFFNSSKIFILSLLLKKVLIEFSWVSPIPSIFNNSLKFLYLDKLLNFENDLKYFDKIFAFSNPICLIPNEYISLSREIFFFWLIEYFKFCIDCWPQPSSFSIFLKSNLKISCGNFSNLSFQKFSTIFFPKPSILKASLDTKCFNFSIAIFSQI